MLWEGVGSTGSLMAPEEHVNRGSSLPVKGDLLCPTWFGLQGKISVGQRVCDKHFFNLKRKEVENNYLVYFIFQMGKLSDKDIMWLPKSSDGN